MKDLSDLLEAATEKVLRIASGEGSGGVKTDFPELDDILGGIRKSEIYVIHSSSELLSSSLAYDLILNLSEQGKPALKLGIITWRLGEEEIAMQLLTQYAKLNLKPFCNMEVTTRDFVNLQKSLHSLSKKSIKLKSHLTSVDELIKSVKKMVSVGCRVILLDGLELSSLKSKQDFEVKALFDKLKTSLRSNGVSLLITVRDSDDFNSKYLYKYAEVFTDIQKPEGLTSNSEGEWSIPLVIRKNCNGLMGSLDLGFDPSISSYFSPQKGEEELKAKQEQIEQEPDAYWCEELNQWIKEPELWIDVDN